MPRFIRTVSLFLIPLSAIVAGCGSSDQSDPARSGTGTTASTNAANEYRRIHAALDPALIETCRDLEGLPDLTMELQEALDAHGSLLEDLLAASMLEHCDFGTDYGKGVGTLLPHIADMREMAVTLHADALRYGNAGESQDAARRVVAITRMGRHIAAAEPNIVGKLSGFGLLGLAEHAASELLSYDMLTDDSRHSVLEEIRRIDLHNPLDARGALALERQMAVTSLRNARGYDPDLDFDFSTFPDAAREEAIAQAGDAIAEMEAVWDHPDAVNEMRRIKDGLSNPFAQYMVAGIPAYRETIDRCEAFLREMIDELGD